MRPDAEQVRNCCCLARRIAIQVLMALRDSHPGTSTADALRIPVSDFGPKLNWR